MQSIRLRCKVTLFAVWYQTGTHVVGGPPHPHRNPGCRGSIADAVGFLYNTRRWPELACASSRVNKRVDETTLWCRVFWKPRHTMNDGRTAQQSLDLTCYSNILLSSVMLLCEQFNLRTCWASG